MLAAIIRRLSIVHTLLSSNLHHRAHLHRCAREAASSLQLQMLSMYMVQTRGLYMEAHLGTAFLLGHSL